MTDSQWWRGAAIYQIYPRSFQDSDGSGTGDLKGITRRLVHVASLGVDAIWLSPFFRSPMADMGYDVADYCDVDPLFGTLADFDALVAEAKRLGLRVVIDQVLSHTSDRHPWFVESRSSRENDKADWYVWADPRPDGTAPNNWLSIFGGPAWEWDSVRRQYYMHNFLASQPDLNFHAEGVQKAALDVARFWLMRGVDGFRLDAVNYCFHDRDLSDNPPLPGGAIRDVPETNPYGFQDHIHDKSQPEMLPFLEAYRAVLDAFPGSTSIGEVGDGPRSLATVAAYTEGGRRLHMCYTFDLLSPDFTPAHIRSCVTGFEAAVKGGWVCWSFSNHDVPRHASRWAMDGRDRDAVARFAINLMVCLRGSIGLYQGEELGLGEADIAYEDIRDPYGRRFWPAFKGRDGCRTPMPWDSGLDHAGFSAARPWLPVPAEHRALAVSVQEGDPGSVLHHYRAALAVRRLHQVLRTGSIDFIDLPENEGETGLAFVRSEERRRVLCAFNMGTDDLLLSTGLDLAGARPIGLPGRNGMVVEDGRLSLPPLGHACLMLA